MFVSLWMGLETEKVFLENAVLSSRWEAFTGLFLVLYLPEAHIEIEDYPFCMNL